jgi:hypothetical protein
LSSINAAVSVGTRVTSDDLIRRDEVVDSIDSYVIDGGHVFKGHNYS